MKTITLYKYGKKIKMSLDDIWIECLRMWKWIDEKIGKKEDYDSDDLRENWGKINGYIAGCFFCEWACRNGSSCNSCPGKLVDSEFNCFYRTYSYCNYPHKFYQKLVRLHKIYLKNKSTKHGWIIQKKDSDGIDNFVKDEEGYCEYICDAQVFTSRQKARWNILNNSGIDEEIVRKVGLSRNNTAKGIVKGR